MESPRIATSAEPARSARGGFASLIYPPIEEIGARNEKAFVLLFLLVPLAGSLLSVIVGFLAVWALISLVMRRFAFHIDRTSRWIVFSNLAFYLVLVATDLMRHPPSEVAEIAVTRLFFIVPLIIVSRMRLTKPQAVLPAAFFGAAMAGVVLLPAVLVEHFLLDHDRVSLLSGNSGPLSIAATVTAGLALLHLRPDADRRSLVLAGVGCCGACVAVLLTGMRGAWPALLVVVLIALWFRREPLLLAWRGLRRSGQRTVLGVGALAAVLVALIAIPAMLDRVGMMQDDLVMLDTAPKVGTSVNMRLDMYSAAVEAIARQPLFGYGSSGLWPAVKPYLDPIIFDGFSFSHLHNIFLTIGVDAGVVGILALLAVLLSPIITAFNWRHAPGGRDRLAFALVVVLAFLIPGLSNIMFFHDILDAIWALSVSTLCAALAQADEKTLVADETGNAEA